MRRDLAVLGTGLVVVGAALSLSPATGAALSGHVNPTILASLGLLVALVGAAVTREPGAVTREPGAVTREPGADAPETAEVARRPDRPAPLGAEFDETLARVEAMSAVELRSEDGPAELRERVREAAVARLAHRGGGDRETAAARVERGEWTDDPVAAAFLSPSVRAPPSVRWREFWSTTPRVVSRARRTVAVLEGEP